MSQYTENELEEIVRQMGQHVENQAQMHKLRSGKFRLFLKKLLIPLFFFQKSIDISTKNRIKVKMIMIF